MFIFPSLIQGQKDHGSGSSSKNFSIPDPGFEAKKIPDPGVKKAPDPQQ